MKIKVVSVGNPWKATPTSDELYTIVVEGEGEPQKTYDKALAVIGEHEAESFTSKTGKTYWRSPKEATVAPEPTSNRNSSIEWQTSLKAAVEAVNNFYLLYPKTDQAIDLKEYKKDIVNAAITFAKMLEMQPEESV